MRSQFSVSGNASRGPILERVADILLAFADEPVMTIPALSARLCLAPSTAYRFVGGLRRRGFLNATGGGRYQLGPRVLQLAEVARQQLSLVDLSEPVMVDLSRRTGETSLLTTVAGDQALAVRQVAAPQPIRLTFQPGVARPLHAGASAKILFAFLDEPRRQRLLRQGQFERHTARTVTDPVRLRHQLDDIRARGYVVTTGEYDEASSAVAAPIRDPGGEIWALSIVTPAARMTTARLPRLVRAVVEAAQLLEDQLRGLPPRVATAQKPRRRQAARSR
jgi:IclR family acetate operon transcriptional repressor